MYEVYTAENKKWHFSKGQSRPGSKNGKSSLKEEDVILIRKRRDNGEDYNIVYKDYKDKIQTGGFYSIWKNKTWKNLL